MFEPQVQVFSVKTPMKPCLSLGLSVHLYKHLEKMVLENLLGQHLDVQYRLVVATAGSAKDYELEEAD